MRRPTKQTYAAPCRTSFVQALRNFINGGSALTLPVAEATADYMEFSSAWSTIAAHANYAAHCLSVQSQLGQYENIALTNRAGEELAAAIRKLGEVRENVRQKTIAENSR